MSPSGATNEDQATIRRLVEDWVVLRDAGFWEDFARVWHDDGWMTATWFQGSFRDFITASREGWERGVEISHFLGGFTTDIQGERAVAQTKMKIEQRAEVDGVIVDVVCTGRFYDFLESREGRWGLVRRQPIYERDRLTPLDPAAQLTLDSTRLESFPSGYRYLGYVQEGTGHRVMRGLPGLRGAEVEKLYIEGGQWLAGSAKPGDALRDLT